MDFQTSIELQEFSKLEGGIMVLSTYGKWFNEKITKLKVSYDEEHDEEVDRFMDKEYFRLLKFAALYAKFDKRNPIFTILQLVFYLSIMFYHTMVLIRTTFLTMHFNMVLFCQSTHLTCLFLLGSTLLVCFQTKRRQMMRLHRLLYSGFFNYEEPSAPGEEELRSAMTRELRMLIMIPLGVALCGATLLIAAPIVDMTMGSFDEELLNREFSTHLPYRYAKYPHQTKEGFVYHAAFAGQFLTTTMVVTVIGTSSFLYLNAMQNISLQLKILLNSMDHLEARAVDMNFRLFGKSKCDVRSLYGDRQFSYCYSMCLIKNFKHHQVILRAFRYTEDILSIPVFLAYITGTLVIALSLISAGSVKELPGTTIASMVLCGVEVGHMFLLSLFGQRIGDLNSELRFKIYSSKWYLCNRSIKGNMSIFLEMTKKPLIMKVGGIIPADMETFVTVMNSAYSFYNIINAF